MFKNCILLSTFIFEHVFLEEKSYTSHAKSYTSHDKSYTSHDKSYTSHAKSLKTKNFQNDDIIL